MIDQIIMMQILVNMEIRFTETGEKWVKYRFMVLRFSYFHTRGVLSFYRGNLSDSKIAGVFNFVYISGDSSSSVSFRPVLAVL